MKLSFIKPRQKGILKRDTRYWLYFITVSSTAMFGLYGAMEYEIAKIKADTKKATEDRKFFSDRKIFPEIKLRRSFSGTSRSAGKTEKQRPPTLLVQVDGRLP